ncbi:hypothetical protein DDE01_06690 [Desulfovibrio desulfuricans]|nr:hypothetical protein DDE01_06690 [Desulfovibrio desulfuricans]
MRNDLPEATGGYGDPVGMRQCPGMSSGTESRVVMDRLLRLNAVLELVPVASSTWREWSRSGKAPAKVKRGRSTFWRESEVLAFISGAWNPSENQDSPRMPAS